MAVFSRCPHCGRDTIGRLARLAARAKAPAICPACGGRSRTGITPLSLLLQFVLALFAGGFLYIAYRTPLVRLERYALQRNLAIAAVAAMALGGAGWWWFSGSAAG